MCTAPNQGLHSSSDTEQFTNVRLIYAAEKKIYKFILSSANDTGVQLKCLKRTSSEVNHLVKEQQQHLNKDLHICPILNHRLKSISRQSQK